MTDRLTLTRAFESAGIQSEIAERLTTEIYDAIHESVATKADLKADLAELEENINATKARDLYHIRTSMTAELAALDKKITVVGYQLITGLSILMVVIAALLFGVAALLAAARLSPVPKVINMRGRRGVVPLGAVYVGPAHGAARTCREQMGEPVQDRTRRYAR